MKIFKFSKNKNTYADSFSLSLTAVFGVLCHSDDRVMREIRDCLLNTELYFAEHQEQFDKRDIVYSFGGEKWIQLISAVDAMEACGYAVELDSKATSKDFVAALDKILAVNNIEFSLKNLQFVHERTITDWTAQFNEYAGQSGITIYSIDIDSENFVLGAAQLADYAEAANIGAMSGITISCRLNTTAGADSDDNGTPA